MLVIKEKDDRPILNPGIIYTSRTFNQVIDNVARDISPKRGVNNKKATKVIVGMIFSNCLSSCHGSFILKMSKGVIISGKHYSYTILSGTIKKLVSKGYIEYTSGKYIQSSKFYRPSSIAPTNRLIGLISRNCGGVTIKNDKIERVIIKDSTLNEKLRSNRSVINSMEDDIKEIEERLSKYNFQLGGKRLIFSPIYRFFKHDLNNHGRMYSPILFMKKSKRLQLLIDNEPTTEIDLISSTVNIAILKLGHTPPADFYAFHHDRDVSKIVTMVCFYSKRKKWLSNACSKALKDKCDKAISNMNEVVDRAENWFNLNGIRSLFCAGRGLEFMKYEADFCVDLVLTCLRNQIPVISIHDAFICKKTDRSKVRMLIDLIYKRHFGSLPSCKIKS